MERKHHVQTCLGWLNSAVALVIEKGYFEPMGYTCNMGHRNSWKKSENYCKNLHFRAILISVWGHIFMTFPFAYMPLLSSAYIYIVINFYILFFFPPLFASFVPHATGCEWIWITFLCQWQVGVPNWSYLRLCCEKFLCLQFLTSVLNSCHIIIISKVCLTINNQQYQQWNTWWR